MVDPKIADVPVERIVLPIALPKSRFVRHNLVENHAIICNTCALIARSSVIRARVPVVVSSITC